MYSKKTLSNYDFLDFASCNFNLKFKFVDSNVCTSATGIKRNYVPSDFSLNSHGYLPEYESIETIKYYLES